MAELTPMMKQYMETKSQYPDCILFYRLGNSSPVKITLMLCIYYTIFFCITQSKPEFSPKKPHSFALRLRHFFDTIKEKYILSKFAL